MIRVYNIKKKVKILLLLLFVINISAMPVYSAYFNFYPARDVNNETIVVTGDSYAGYFATYECYQDYNIIIYADAGKSTRENYDIMDEAIKLEPDTIIISIGVNDHNKNEPVIEFKQRIAQILKTSADYNKRVILHTYMDYDIEMLSHKELDYNTKEYDAVLKELASKHKNAFYIDMSDYNNEFYLQPDRIHYNRIFYDALYNRISTAMMLF